MRPEPFTARTPFAVVPLKLVLPNELRYEMVTPLTRVKARAVGVHPAPKHARARPLIVMSAGGVGASWIVTTSDSCPLGTANGRAPSRSGRVGCLSAHAQRKRTSIVVECGRSRLIGKSSRCG